MPKLPPGHTFADIAAEHASMLARIEADNDGDRFLTAEHARRGAAKLIAWAPLLDELLAMVNALTPAEAARSSDRAGLPAKGVT